MHDRGGGMPAAHEMWSEAHRLLAASLPQNLWSGLVMNGWSDMTVTTFDQHNHARRKALEAWSTIVPRQSKSSTSTRVFATTPQDASSEPTCPCGRPGHQASRCYIKEHHAELKLLSGQELWLRAKALRDAHFEQRKTPKAGRSATDSAQGPGPPEFKL